MSRTSTQSDPPLDNCWATESGLAAQALVVESAVAVSTEKLTLLTLLESNPERGPSPFPALINSATLIAKSWLSDS